jgi:hypothetical protein
MLAVVQQEVVMRGIAPSRVVAFLMLAAACGAWCQVKPSADSLQGLQPDGPIPPGVERPAIRDWKSLPDAPAPARSPGKAEGSHTSGDEANSPLTLRAIVFSPGGIGQPELGRITPEPQASFTALHPLAIPKEPDTFFDKYMYPQLLNPEPSYTHSSSNSFLGRASYAASSIFITRNGSGRGRLNTSYFLGMLTLAAVHTAYRPYGTRSTSTAFNDFGVSIGSNAGIKVFHEFEPGIRQRVKGVTPKFVTRIQDRISHSSTPKE